MAITGDGSYFGQLMKGWINSSIYLEFLMNLEKWIKIIRSTNTQKLIILNDNLQVHRAIKLEVYWN